MGARYWLVATLLSAPLLSAASVVAQPAAAQSQQADTYTELVGLFVGASNNEAALQAIIRQVGDAFLTGDPSLAALEARHPGLMDRMLVAMTPMVREHSQGATARFHASFVDLLRRNLTAAEAADAVGFYGSPLGRRLLTTVNANVRHDNLVAEAVAEREAVQISESSVAADAQRNITTALDSLTDADMAEIARRLTGRSWVVKFQSLMPQMVSLRAEAENTPMDPALMARMQAAIRVEVDKAVGAGSGGK